MRKSVGVVLAVVAGAATVLALAAAPAAAGPSWSKSWLTVTIGAPETPGPSDRTEPISVWLWCDPPGGTHPHAAQACEEISAVDGDIAAIGSGSGGCGGVWQPVEISVSGRWQGTQIRFSETVSNEGCARISHGHVFRISPQ